MFTRSALARLAALHEPASTADIQSAGVALGFPLPTPYVDLLLCSNGLEPTNPAYGISLFAAQELLSMAEAYEVPLNLPNYLFIGFDGGSRGILLGRASLPAPVYLDAYELFVPEGLRLISHSLVDWVERGFTLEDRL